jgi:hypothetical protein
MCIHLPLSHLLFVITKFLLSFVENCLSLFASSDERMPHVTHLLPSIFHMAHFMLMFFILITTCHGYNLC